MLWHVSDALQIAVLFCSAFHRRDCCALADMYWLHWVSESVTSGVACWRNTITDSGTFLSVTVYRWNMWILHIFTKSLCYYWFDSSVVETPELDTFHWLQQYSFLVMLSGGPCTSVGCLRYWRGLLCSCQAIVFTF